MINLPFPFEPITTLNWVQIIGEYIFFVVSAGILATVTSYLYKGFGDGVAGPTHTTQSFDLLSVILAGPIEEMTFRGLAYGLTVSFALPLLPLLYLANAAWAGLHVRGVDTFVYVFVFGLFLSKFWYQGFHGLWWMAILIHTGHNVFVQLVVRQSNNQRIPIPRPHTGFWKDALKRIYLTV